MFSSISYVPGTVLNILCLLANEIFITAHWLRQLLLLPSSSLFLSPFYRWGSWNSENLDNWSRVTRLVRDGPGTCNSIVCCEPRLKARRDTISQNFLAITTTWLFRTSKDRSCSVIIPGLTFARASSFVLACVQTPLSTQKPPCPC